MLRTSSLALLGVLSLASAASATAPSGSQPSYQRLDLHGAIAFDAPRVALPPPSDPALQASARVGRQMFEIRTGTPLAGAQGWQMTLGGKPLAILPPGQRGWGTLSLGPGAGDTLAHIRTPKLASLQVGCKAKGMEAGMVEATLLKGGYAPRYSFQGNIEATLQAVGVVEGQRVVVQRTGAMTIAYVVWTTRGGDFAVVRLAGDDITGCLYLKGTGWVENLTLPPSPFPPAPQPEARTPGF